MFKMNFTLHILNLNKSNEKELAKKIEGIYPKEKHEYVQHC